MSIYRAAWLLVVAVMILVVSLQRCDNSPFVYPRVARLLSTVDDSITHEEHVERFASCRALFLDFGSNVGVQVRKLFEPALYVNASILPIFDTHFGVDVAQRRKSTCAIGFEGNRKHTERLVALEACYRRIGWQVHFFTETAIGSADRLIAFFSDHAKYREDWGASIFDWTHRDRRSPAREIDAVRFLTTVQRLLTNVTTIVAKFDIEASEFHVLPPLLEHNLLCRSFITTAIIEWHRRFVPAPMRGVAGYIEEHFADMLARQDCRPSNRSTDFANYDDESYLHDSMSLPSACR